MSSLNPITVYSYGFLFNCTTVGQASDSTVSHFSYAPLIKCKIIQKEIRYFKSETTSVKRIYSCISHRNFIVIRSETNEKMDLEGHYPQNTISHCIISNETQITMHFFQGRISALPEIRTDLFLPISKSGMCLLILFKKN